MRFLADENFPGSAVAALAELGHDIVWIRTVAPGAVDLDVLAWAVRESRTLLTFDKDFGEIARNTVLPAAACGVILVRMPLPRDNHVGLRLAALIAAREEWVGHFSVLEPGRVRMRQLPAS